jgi:hypothetical protein
VYIYVYVLKKERNKSKWIVCEEFSPKTLLLPPSVLAQQLNTTQYSLCIPQSPPDGPTA